MKTLKILFLFLLLSGTVEVIAVSPPPRPHPGGGRHVNTPLDGGLLSILGAAGIVYYLVRKKKNRNDQ